MEWKEQNRAIWSDKAVHVEDDREVTLPDLVQRNYEHRFLEKSLAAGMNVLEVGCGNGYTASHYHDRVGHWTGFDLSQELIERAERSWSRDNTTFRVGDALDPDAYQPGNFDLVLICRVLINLGGDDQAQHVIGLCRSALRPGGALILMEGVAGARARLSKLRVRIGLDELADISHQNIDLDPERLDAYIRGRFEVVDLEHTGLYDVITRVFLPSLVAPASPGYNTEFHEEAMKLQEHGDWSSLSRFGRLALYRLKRPA